MASFASISGKYARILPSKLKFTATTKTIAGAISGTTIAAGAYYHTQSGGQFSGTGNNGKRNFSKSAAVAGATGANIKIAKVPEGKSFEDYQEVYNAIATKIAEHLSFDHNDGYYATLVRLSWHTSGTYSKADNSGGSFGGTMIFPPEEMDYENNGLSRARSFLAEFQVRYPWISRGDLWTLGGVCGVQESSGPKIEWRPGRVDDNSGYSPENGRIPSGTIDDGAEIKRFFSRMGLDAKDTVALIGAHVLGRAHQSDSNFDGPWSPQAYLFTNDFYENLMQNWHVRPPPWSGNKQYQDDETNELMMTPSDMTLKEYPEFLKYTKIYAKDQDAWFRDFAPAYTKLLELGITYPEDQKPMVFKTLDEQAN